MARLAVGLLLAIFMAIFCNAALATFSCKYEVGGKTYDFSKVPTLQGRSPNGLTTYINMCKNVDKCTDGGSSICAPKDQGGGGIPGQSDIAFGSMTNNPKPTVSALSGSAKGIQVSYNNGAAQCWGSGDDVEPRKTVVSAICGSSDDISFTMDQDDDDNCKFYLKFTSKAACGMEDGLSGGAIFLIIVFSVWAAYFIFGFLLCKFYLKKPTIKESIPHYHFWSTLPYLYLAGCKVAIAFVQAKISGKKGGSIKTDSADDYGSYEESV